MDHLKKKVDFFLREEKVDLSLFSKLNPYDATTIFDFNKILMRVQTREETAGDLRLV